MIWDPVHSFRRQVTLFISVVSNFSKLLKQSESEEQETGFTYLGIMARSFTLFILDNTSCSYKTSYGSRRLYSTMWVKPNPDLTYNSLSTLYLFGNQYFSLLFLEIKLNN